MTARLERREELRTKMYGATFPIGQAEVRYLKPVSRSKCGTGMHSRASRSHGPGCYCACAILYLQSPAAKAARTVLVNKWESSTGWNYLGKVLGNLVLVLLITKTLSGTLCSDHNCQLEWTD
jgi:hypothetical protein